MQRYLRQFFAHETSAGLIMLAMAALAMLAANSDVADSYQGIFHTPVLGHYSFSVLIADILMPIFFLKVGLELKEEMLEGALATKAQRLLPLAAALGGIIVPALFYLAIIGADETLRAGWAIPSATDIAFAICVVNLAGKFVPPAAKIFLLAIAIYDDLAAIMIIALFYAGSFSWLPALGALITVLAMLIVRRKPEWMPVILLLGAALAFLLHEAGIHTTVAGLITGLCIHKKRMHSLTHHIDPWVAFGIMPVFAFANAGFSLENISIRELGDPLPLGILLGLFLGKQLGIFAATYLAVTFKIAPKPKAVSWGMLYAMGVTAGIGFTMSLFIGQLAFPSAHLLDEVKLGVLAGSLLSAIIGYGCCRFWGHRSTV